MQGPQILLTQQDVAVSGSGSVMFAFSESATGSESMTGAGAVAFAFSEAGSGSESFTGTSAVVWPFSMAATGTESITGTAAVSFGFALSGAGTLASNEGSVTFGFALDGQGDIANPAVRVRGRGTPVGAAIVTGPSQRVIRRISKPVLVAPEPIAPIYASGDVSFAFGLRGRGDVNDDDLAWTLLEAA